MESKKKAKLQAAGKGGEKRGAWAGNSAAKAKGKAAAPAPAPAPAPPKGKGPAKKEKIVEIVEEEEEDEAGEEDLELGAEISLEDPDEDDGEDLEDEHDDEDDDELLDQIEGGDDDDEEEEEDVEGDDEEIEDDEEGEDANSDDEIEKLLEEEQKDDDDNEEAAVEEGAASAKPKAAAPVAEKSKSKGQKKREKKARRAAAAAAGQAQVDDSDTESSDEEHVKNTLGNIPIEWYDDYPHLGYDLEGKKILKTAVKKDELDKFLEKMEDPENWWRTMQDKVTDKEVVLSDKEVEMIERITGGHFPDSEYNPFENYIDFFTGEKMIHPVSNRPEPKSRFIPSKWEAKKIVKLARAIKMGWIKVKEQVVEKERFYLIWDKKSEEEALQRPMNIPPPKLKLPTHIESYNPPEEYLFTAGQLEEWKRNPTERKINFIPQKYKSLREVPGYDRFIQERFERCLDLYLCPRVKKNRVNIDPDSLIPKLPNPRDLQPFPTTLSIVYEGHTDKVRAVSVDPTGQWLSTGSDDKTVRIWEVSTGRCVKVIQVPDIVHKVAWNPNKFVNVVIIACGKEVWVINPMTGSEETNQATDELIKESFGTASNKEASIEWVKPLQAEQSKGVRLILKHNFEVRFVVWHHKGDYFSSVCPDGKSKSVYIHQLTKQASQNPFKKNAGLIQCVEFHPSKPVFYVATQKTVRVYNLMQQQLIKKLQSSSKWISSMSIHPKGDNVIIGSYDKRLSWFDMDLSTRPYKVLRYHTYAIRSVAFHKSYPLFASASDDGTLQIFHGMVYNDLLQNPLIVPLKILKGHKIVDEYGILDCTFHPYHPWVFTSGADSKVHLFC